MSHQISVRPNPRKWLAALGVTITAFSALVAHGGLVTDVSGTSVWFDATQITGLVDGNNLATWNDTSGNNFHATQATVGNQPVYRDAANGLNGRPVIAFSNDLQTAAATGDRMFTPSIPSANDFSLLLVWNMVDDVGTQIPIAKFDQASKREWAFFKEGANTNAQTSTSTNGINRVNKIYTSTPLPLAFPVVTYALDIFTKSGTAGPLWQNGTLDNGNATNLHATLFNGSSSIGLGTSTGATSSHLRGNIAEAVVYNRTLNGGERVVLQNYMAAKWGQSLTADDFYVGDEAANGDYDADVIGIGQSAGAKLATSHGSGLRLSELGTTLDADNEFVLAGHKTDANALTTADIGSLSGVNQRWSRTWFVDGSGDVGTTLQFDFSDSGLAAPDNGTFSLLYSATNAFSFTVLSTTGTVTNSDQVGFDLASGFADGYYTLGLATVAAHPGDFDSDGDVDGADFVAWQTNFPKATGATLAQGDADSDGDVDGADFVVWQTNFPFSPGPGAAPVPEPAAQLLLAIGGVILLARRRNRGKLRGNDNCTAIRGIVQNYFVINLMIFALEIWLCV